VRFSLFWIWLALCVPAQAHSAFGPAGSFWSGAGHVLTSPLAIALIVALACRFAPQQAGRVYLGVAAFAAASALSATVLTGPFWGPLAAIIVGGLAAWSPISWRWEPVALGVIAGAGLGADVALDEIGLASVLGVAATAAIATTFAFEGLAALERVGSMPRRVVGSWAAALGLLLAALALRG
jgi:hypothetical protein